MNISWTSGLSGALLLAALAACTSTSTAPTATGAAPAESMLIVDCLAPPQVRQLGAFARSMAPRQPLKLPAKECADIGGEYALASQDPKAALGIWLPFAQQGNSDAQVQVGELYERGIGAVPDPASAAQWYQRAADQGNSRAAINLAALYERGFGVPRDAALAARWFRRASGLGPAPARLSIHFVQPLMVLPTTSAAPTLRLPGPKLNDELVARVAADAGVHSVRVNGKPVPVRPDGEFRVALQWAAGRAPVQVRAQDRAGNAAQVSFTALAADAPADSAAASSSASLSAGDYHALIIANQNYQHFEQLDTPLRDARDLKALLERRYGFKVTVITDATRRDMFVALNALRSRLSARDHLLLFYAGHGEIDPATRRGYWVPVDGEKNNRARWVSVLEVTDQIAALPARQVLVVADSCYSGTMARSLLPAAEAEAAPALSQEALATMARQRARVVLTSGGLEPVIDSGGGGNSLFARSLLDVLQAVNAPIEARRLHEELAVHVAVRAERLNFKQLPEYAPIRFAGHEAGDFVFVPRVR
jgi:uncharacterized protein